MEYRLVAKLFTDTYRGQPNIRSILKLENKTIQENFLNELRKNFDKYRDKAPTQLIKLLFHGTKNDPAQIYESEDGLDIRFAAFGLSG